MTATTSTKKKKVVVNTAQNDARRQAIRTTIQKVIESKFKSTLGQEKDIVNIFLALVHLESHFNVNAMGKPVSPSVSSGARDYWNSTVVQNVINTGTPAQKANLPTGYQAIGLTQVMGWNVVRGASKATNRCEVERLRPDLVDQLCSSAGDDLTTKFLGESGMENIITAGLVILEGKWKAVTQVKDGWKAGSWVFPLRISAAVAAYLGLGKKDVVTGITPTSYAASIVGGSNYLAANGTSSPIVRDSQTQTASSSGPIINIASANNQAVAGCLKG